MLELRDVSAGYGRATVLHGVSLTLGEGEVVALIGANGAGKSTLAKAISGLLPLRRGAVVLRGEVLDRLRPGDRLRRGLVHVPEGRQVFAALTVAENLSLGCYARRGPAAAAGEAAQRRAALELFPALSVRLGEPAANLSGGQQQMLAIARGLMSNPRVLVLDEPSLGLSPALVADVFRMIRTLRERGMSILLSEQNAQQSLAVSDRGYVLENGRVVLSGPARDLLSSRDIAERYLGAGASSAIEAPSGHDGLARRLAAALEL